MRLDALTKYAEIIASVAVVISLVVLIAEIRENTETAKRASYESLSRQVSQWRLARVTHPDLHSLYHRETGSPEEWTLQGEDRDRFVDYMQVLWQVYEQAFFARRSGDLGTAEWERFTLWICDRPPPEHAWKRIKTVMSEPFVAFVSSCRKPEA